MIYQTGDIILYKNLKDSSLKWLFGELVKLITDGEYVHSAIYLGRHDKFGYIIAESVASGFLIRVHNDLGQTILRYKDGLNNKQKDQIIYRCLAMSGYSYGYFDLIKILFYKITGAYLFPSTVKQLTCSEAITRVYKHISIDLSYHTDNDLVTPNDLYQSPQLKNPNLKTLDST